MKFRTTPTLTVIMLTVMTTSFAAALILSAIPPYRAVAYAGAAYLALTVLSIPLATILGVIAVFRKHRTDIAWSCVLFMFSAGPLTLLAVGGCVFDKL